MISNIPPQRSFGDWLRQQRRALDLSREKFACQVGCSAVTLRKLESEERRPSPLMAERLADVLDIVRDDRPSFLQFARGNPFAAPVAVPEAPAAKTFLAPNHNLPLQLTSFIGREQELADIARLLRVTRLLTLCGPGGSGKTRLALQTSAAQVDRYPDGVWMVELAALADPALLPQTIATVLGVKDPGGQLLTERLAEQLRPRQLLLLLDNCEHLIGACAKLAEHLLRTCPEVTILATSRENLAIAGELVRLVPPLSLPALGASAPPEAVAESEAVRLFCDRAQAVAPALTLTTANAAAIAVICRQLDGLPLAIELAASRLRLLTLEQIVARLDDCFGLLTNGSRTALPRHQTLQALVDWSYELLSPPERSLLCSLAVFAGGWTLEAAEAVCADDNMPAGSVLDLLTHLVNKSLVVAVGPPDGEARYYLLETIRQYAYAKLAASGEAATLRRRHALYFGSPAWRSDGDLDDANLRRALHLFELALQTDSAG
jgi:predicted ATPase/DNA-binding XRE family transcriptional regulator